MLDIEVYKRLSPKAKEFYEKHEDYFDEMADKWDDYVDMVTVIETATKRGKIEDHEN